MGDHYGRHEIEADRRKNGEPPYEGGAGNSFLKNVIDRQKEKRKEWAAASIQEFKNDLKGMSPEKMKRELEDVTRRIEQDEPWQEALTAALEFPELLPKEEG